MRIGLITTLNTNIGDDFIREGICIVLRQVYKDVEIEFVPINKHKPLTVYPKWHPIQLSNKTHLLPRGKYRLKHLIEKYASVMKLSHFDNCDLIVQCGAPVFWPNCSKNEWAQPIWHDIVGRIFKKIPVFNLAAGSCYPWEKQTPVIDNKEDTHYIKSILNYCTLTTVRDRLAQAICNDLGQQVCLIPCSAFLAGKEKIAALNDSGFILINYMEGGGHYEWAQDIDSTKWETTIRNLVKKLQKRHKLAFLCHNKNEEDIAHKKFPDFPCFYPKTTQEYFQCIENAKFGLCNRMHASVGMAGSGIPSIAVCTDTRLLMVEAIGLPIHYVKDVDENNLENEIEIGLTSRHKEKDRLLDLQANTIQEYIETINNTINKSKQ